MIKSNNVNIRILRCSKLIINIHHLMLVSFLNTNNELYCSNRILCRKTFFETKYDFNYRNSKMKIICLEFCARGYT